MGRTRAGVRAESAGVGFVTGGIDVGVASIKTALFVHGFRGVEVLATNLTLVRVPGTPGDHRAALRASWADVLSSAGVADVDVAYLASTGVRDQIAFRVGHFLGQISQATGARFLFPGAGALLDCGVRHIRGAVLNDDGQVIRRLSRRWPTDPATAVGLALALVDTLKVEGSLALIGGRTNDRAFLLALQEGLGAGHAPVRLLTAADGLFVGAYGAALLAARRYQRLLGQIAAAPVLSRSDSLARRLN